MVMATLHCYSVAKLQILALAALPKPNDTSPSISPHPHLKPSPLPKPISKKFQEKLQQKQGRQPSVSEIERAIGAGIFRDRDVNSEAEEKTSLFDNLLKNSVGSSEGSVEKKLRETGDWLTHRTERTSRSAGKQILMSMFIWVLPIWVVAFLVASGMIQLPFLEDIVS